MQLHQEFVLMLVHARSTILVSRKL